MTEPELVRYISCKCGESEEFMADQPRTDCQIFTHVHDFRVTNNAVYECPKCKELVVSEVLPREP